jgi:hypothetical protein
VTVPTIARTVFQAWKIIEYQNLSADNSEAMREFGRYMFYSGAHGLFHLVEQVCTVQARDTNTEMGAQRVAREIEQLHEELMAFNFDHKIFTGRDED